MKPAVTGGGGGRLAPPGAVKPLLRPPGVGAVGGDAGGGADDLLGLGGSGASRATVPAPAPAPAPATSGGDWVTF